ncbi:c-type cytochrome [Zoogloea sp.]|uniref:c-type cytochrome n=1 Tax=Zoogloea sp. TaxID=49181 RepID=UPI0025E059EC|nr:c-type cytochrome [Zoogloea sp.]MCK6395136.1 c-type cytochrome [Zoogloea sp.]
MAAPMPARRILRCLSAVLLTLSSALATAEVADPNVVVDTSSLPPIAVNAPEGNPYRGNPRAAEIGRAAFNQACSRCHGIDAVNKGQVGPDLLKMDRSCPRIADPVVRQLCVLDQDDFFLKSVQDGKTRVGVVHMPAWKEVLSPAAIWTIRSFLESSSR